MGRSLVPLMMGEQDDFEVTSFAEGDFCTAVNYGSWKMMRVDSTDSVYLFDLSLDPREIKDRSGVNPSMRSRMHGLMMDYLGRAAAIDHSHETPMDEETIRQLKALGYL